VGIHPVVPVNPSLISDGHAPVLGVWPLDLASPIASPVAEVGGRPHAAARVAWSKRGLIAARHGGSVVIDGE